MLLPIAIKMLIEKWLTPLGFKSHDILAQVTGDDKLKCWTKKEALKLDHCCAKKDIEKGVIMRNIRR